MFEIERLIRKLQRSADPEDNLDIIQDVETFEIRVLAAIKALKAKMARSHETGFDLSDLAQWHALNETIERFDAACRTHPKYCFVDTRLHISCSVLNFLSHLEQYQSPQFLQQISETHGVGRIRFQNQLAVCLQNISAQLNSLQPRIEAMINSGHLDEQLIDEYLKLGNAFRQFVPELSDNTQYITVQQRFEQTHEQIRTHILNRHHHIEEYGVTDYYSHKDIVSLARNHIKYCDVFHLDLTFFENAIIVGRQTPLHSLDSRLNNYFLTILDPTYLPVEYYQDRILFSQYLYWWIYVALPTLTDETGAASSSCIRTLLQAPLRHTDPCIASTLQGLPFYSVYILKLEHDFFLCEEHYDDTSLRSSEAHFQAISNLCSRDNSIFLHYFYRTLYYQPDPEQCSLWEEGVVRKIVFNFLSEIRDFVRDAIIRGEQNTVSRKPLRHHLKQIVWFYDQQIQTLLKLYPEREIENFFDPRVISDLSIYNHELKSLCLILDHFYLNETNANLILSINELYFISQFIDLMPASTYKSYNIKIVRSIFSNTFDQVVGPQIQSLTGIFKNASNEEEKKSIAYQITFLDYLLELFANIGHYYLGTSGPYWDSGPTLILIFNEETIKNKLNALREQIKNSGVTTEHCYGFRGASTPDLNPKKFYTIFGNLIQPNLSTFNKKPDANATDNPTPPTPLATTDTSNSLANTTPVAPPTPHTTARLITPDEAMQDPRKYAKWLKQQQYAAETIVKLTQQFLEQQYTIPLNGFGVTTPINNDDNLLRQSEEDDPILSIMPAQPIGTSTPLTYIPYITPQLVSQPMQQLVSLESFRTQQMIKVGGTSTPFFAQRTCLEFYIVGETPVYTNNTSSWQILEGGKPNTPTCLENIADIKERFSLKNKVSPATNNALLKGAGAYAIGMYVFDTAYDVYQCHQGEMSLDTGYQRFYSRTAGMVIGGVVFTAFVYAAGTSIAAPIAVFLVAYDIYARTSNYYQAQEKHLKNAKKRLVYEISQALDQREIKQDKKIAALFAQRMKQAQLYKAMLEANNPYVKQFHALIEESLQNQGIMLFAK